MSFEFFQSIHEPPDFGGFFNFGFRIATGPRAAERATSNIVGRHRLLRRLDALGQQCLGWQLSGSACGNVPRPPDVPSQTTLGTRTLVVERMLQAQSSFEGALTGNTAVNIGMTPTSARQAGRLPHNVLRQVKRLAVGNAQVNFPAPLKSASAKRADFRGWVGGGRGRATQSEGSPLPTNRPPARPGARGLEAGQPSACDRLTGHEHPWPRSRIAGGGPGTGLSLREVPSREPDRRRWPCRRPCSDPARDGGPEPAGGRPLPRAAARS